MDLNNQTGIALFRVDINVSAQYKEIWNYMVIVSKVLMYLTLL